MARSIFNATPRKRLSTRRRIRPRKFLLASLLAAFIALNGVAWMQAWAMTHYAPAGQRTAAIEALSPPEKAWIVLTGVSNPRPQNSLTPRGVGLDYETRAIEVDGGGTLEGWYVPHADSPGIVLMFPGYAASKDSLLTSAAALHEMGYDTLLVDFRGVGGSSGQDTTLGVREGTDVARSVEYARRTWPGRPVVLYGVSMGSAASLRAIATEGLQPDAIILESPFNRLLSTVGNRFHAMGLPAFPASELLVFWGSVQQGSNGFNHNPVDYAKSVRCPALLMRGENDPRVTASEVTAITEQLGGPKRFVNFLNATHRLLSAADPALWKSQVAAFLTQVTE
jgi:alpha-beta hydrolase superfamily lysophospholipase